MLIDNYSCHKSFSGDMPLKRVKKSASVQNSPEKLRTPKSGSSEENGRPTRSARKPELDGTPKSASKG